MLAEYKIFVAYQENLNIGWKNISDLKEKDVIFRFIHSGYYYYGYYGKIFNIIEYKGDVSIYQFKEIEIKLPIDKMVICRPNFTNLFLTYCNISDYMIILYLFSFPYNKNYLLISEKIAIELQKCSKYNFNFIYKNGKYYIKNKIINNKIIKNKIDCMNKFWSFKYIYEIVYLNGSNKFYGNEERISLIEIICKKNGIEYNN